MRGERESTDSIMQREKSARWVEFTRRVGGVRDRGCTCPQALGPDGPSAVVYELDRQSCPLHRDAAVAQPDVLPPAPEGDPPVAKTAECATFRVRIKVVPCEGFEMIRVTKGEFLFLKKDDPQRNVIVEADTMASVFEELANGGLYDEFGHGYKTFWRIEEVVEA